MSDSHDIEGYWSGWYAYGMAADDTRIPFSAFIEAVSDTEFTGTTLEPNTFAAPNLRELPADIMGELAEESIIFEKIYNPGPEVHQELIQYLGRMYDEGTRVSGEWHVGAGDEFLSGYFEMTRLSGRVAETEAMFSIDEPVFQLPDEIPDPFQDQGDAEPEPPTGD